MSRCFPFPPPGYEKKTRIDDTDLLTKEKHKEKKHKKDIKDREKKEGKDKKDKERSKEKDRDKKDRKEKHKDRKDKDRDKGKKGTSNETKSEVQPKCNNREKVGPNNLQNNDIGNSKYVHELARRIRDDDRATGSQSVQKIKVTDQRRAELLGRMVESNISDPSEEKEKAKDKKEDDRKVNGQRNHVVARGFEKSVVQQFFGMDQKRVDGITKPMEEKDVRKQMKWKEKIKQKESGSKGDKPKNKNREKKSKSKDKDRDKEKKKEEKEKAKAKEISEAIKEQPKLNEGGARLKESGKDTLAICNIKPPSILKTSSNSPAAEGNLGKRKELEINGYLHDNGNRPNKLPRLVSSSHPVMENGSKLEPCETSVQFASQWPGEANNCKVDIKEHRINGVIEAQRPNVCSARSLPSSVQVNENREASAKPPHPDIKEHRINGLVEAQRPDVCSARSLPTTVQVNENRKASAKPPHPDSKYLSQILSVPNMEDLPDFDDQKWLFGSNYMLSKKPKVDSPGVDGVQQVWDQALRIDSADLSALPYVIPF